MVACSIFNPDGSLQVDLSKRLLKFLGTYTITGSQQRGTITHPEFNPGRPFVLALLWPASIDNVPRVALFADRIDWWFDLPIQNSAPNAVTFDYGVY